MLEFFHSFIADKPDLTAYRSKSFVGVILPQNQSVLRAGSHHSVGIVHAFRDQIIYERADVRRTSI